MGVGGGGGGGGVGEVTPPSTTGVIKPCWGSAQITGQSKKSQL